MQAKTIAGITYSKPTVILLQETGIGTAEYAARTCYDSFDASENKGISALNSQVAKTITNNLPVPSLSGVCQSDINHANNIEHSDLLDDLAWTYFHHSILEHANLTYLVKGTSRGVLQEHARHRIQAISVRSTRYTMSGILNAFVASQIASEPRKWFADTLLTFDMFITPDVLYNHIEIDGIYFKLNHQRSILGSITFDVSAIAKSSMHILMEASNPNSLFNQLQAGKKKRNVGDTFKHIVTDNWKVDMVVTFNLRSLKNYLTLRDSGAAYFGIRHLAQAMKEVTPKKYLDLIIKA